MAFAGVIQQTYGWCQCCKEHTRVFIRIGPTYTTQICDKCGEQYNKDKMAKRVVLKSRECYDVRDEDSMLIIQKNLPRKNFTSVVRKDDYILAASNSIIGPSRQENSQANLINLFIAFVAKGTTPSLEMFPCKLLKDTHKCFIIKAIYYYFTKCKIITTAFGKKRLPTDIYNNTLTYLDIGSKTLYEEYITNLMSYGKTDYLEKLKQLLQGSYNLNDIKTVCLDILTTAEICATPKNKIIIEKIHEQVANYKCVF